MKVTISDVAKLAGVSTATVSHTINNTRYVSNETKEKVYRAIEELGYTPDASARSFRTGKKKIIGFIVPDIANKFFATMIESVEKYLSAVSGSTVTTVFPFPSFRASFRAAATLVPDEIPHMIPSLDASSWDVRIASSSVTIQISS